MRRKSFAGTLIALLLIVAAAGASYWYLLRRSGDGQHSAIQAAEKPAPAAPVFVETAPVRVGTVTRDITAVGTLLSNESVMIKPEITGRISEIFFKEGDQVQRGARLVALDDSVYRAELAQAEARIDLQRRNNSRAVELFDRKVATERTRDEAVAAMRTAEADLALARARLDKTRINAPFKGVLGLRRVSVGDYVNPGQDIVNLEDIDPIKVDFRVPESALRLLRVGQAIELQVDAFPGQTFQGQVYAIDPQVDVQGRSVVIRARVPNPDGHLKPGLFARVGLIVERRENAMLVPEQSVVPLEGRSAVFRVIDGTARLTEVQLGQRRAGQVEVVQGLKAGEVVITAGHLKVRDGVRVATAPGA